MLRQEVIIHSYRQSMRHHGPLYINHRQYTRSTAKIKSFLSAYQMVCDAALKTNNFYSGILTSLIFCKFVYVTVTLFMFFLGVVSENLVGTVLTGIWTFCHICHLLLIVSSSSDVTQAAEETAPITCNIIKRGLDPVLNRRLESFLLQLSTQNVAFSGSGFSQITRKMLNSLTAIQELRLAVMVDDFLLEETDSIKVLGMYLDRGLTWDIEKVCSKVASGIYVLRNLAKFCSVDVLKMAYYDCEEAVPHTELKECSDLKKAVRIHSKLNLRESCKYAFRDLGLLTHPYLYLLEMALYCRLKFELVRGRDVHQYGTSGRDNFRVEQHRTAAFEHLSSQVGVRLINPDGIKKFNETRLKHFLMSKAFYSTDEFIF
ncbi:hypothetical protein J6590_027671 [Homalodisca vitripennis]|nr:hypothetical protein J6590_027671 [Homalodisca vitripennis]